MLRRPPRSTRTDTLFPYTTLFRSRPSNLRQACSSFTIFATEPVWLRQFEVGANSAAANRLMDRLEYLQRFDLPADLLDGVPAHRVTRLRRQGERYYADGMRDLPEDRRLAVLAVCTLEWRSSLAEIGRAHV